MAAVSLGPAASVIGERDALQGVGEAWRGEHRVAVDHQQCIDPPRPHIVDQAAQEAPWSTGSASTGVDQLV